MIEISLAVVEEFQVNPRKNINKLKSDMPI